MFHIFTLVHVCICNENAHDIKIILKIYAILFMVDVFPFNQTRVSKRDITNFA